MVQLLDTIDRKILSKLCTNCRVSYESLARETGLSPNAIKNRVASLIDTGVVAKFFVALDREVIGANYFQAIVVTDGTENIDRFVGLMGSNPMIGHISLLASVGGGAYLVWGQYIGTEMLHEIGAFMRSFKETLKVEMHPLLHKDRGLKFKFKKVHLKVLKALIDDPRKLIADIAKESGLAPRTVRRALDEIAAGEAAWFVARPDLAAGGLVNINIRIELEEKKVSMNDMIEWLRSEYPVEFWDPWVSATESILFAEFVVDALYEAEAIAKKIRSLDHVRSTATLVTYSSLKYPYLGEIKLLQMIEKAGI
ncbi:MAG: Lrp/AsnC family transcriptional regulator [Candidatus Thorarchaeota archaeon]|nr:Lrp/AsnC family transcriptional regulator [Candidatus Thorarchaeota archaeon]